MKNYAINAITVLAYFGLLCASYELVNERGLLTLDIYVVDFKVKNLLVSLAGALIVALALPARSVRVSDLLVWLHAAFPVVPMLVLYAFSGRHVEFVALCVGAFLLVRVVSTIRMPVVIPGKLPLNPVLLAWAIVVIGMGSILALGDYGQLDYSVESLYANRAEIKETQFPLFGYVHFAIVKAALPFLLLHYVVKRQAFLFVIVLSCAIFSFFLTLHRASILMPFLVLFLYIATTVSKAQAGRVIIWSLGGMLVVGTLLIYTDLWLIGDVIVRRLFIAPAALNNVYYEYFVTNPHTWFSDSKLSLGIVEPIYDRQVPYIISDYIGVAGGHANTGYLGAGFQQGGTVVVVVYAIVLGLLLRYLDVIGRAIGDPRLTFALSAPGIFWLITSSDFPGTLLTHGLLLTFLLLLAKVVQARAHRHSVEKRSRQDPLIETRHEIGSV